MVFLNVAALCLAVLAPVEQQKLEPWNQNLDIHSMVVGKKALELLENRQLTFRADGEVTGAWISSDGKYIAYYVGEREEAKVLVTKSSGGKPVLLMGSDTAGNRAVGESDAASVWKTDTWPPVNWSPDGRSIAFAASRRTDKIAGYLVDTLEPLYESEAWLLIKSPTGQVLSSLEIPKDSRGRSLIWSPDSTKLACTITGRGLAGCSISLLDVKARTARTLAQLERNDRLDGWNTSAALRYTRWSEDGSESLREINVDNGTDSLVKQLSEPRDRDEHIGEIQTISIPTESEVSPDGKYKLVGSEDGHTCLLDLKSDEMTQLLYTGAWKVVWAPNSRMFLYVQSDDTRREKIGLIVDQTGRRRQQLYQLCLASIEAHKLNHMCVALDSALVKPTCSADCLKIAYISGGRLFVAELGWREPTTWEKLEVKLPLEEADVKTLMLLQGQVIANGLGLYAQQHGKQYPPAGIVEQSILPYMADKLNVNTLPYAKDSDVFLVPGTDRHCFTLLPQPWSKRDPDMDIPGARSSMGPVSLMGVLDAGYDWQVEIYENYGPKVVPKNGKGAAPPEKG